MLADNKCSIYEYPPRTCRTYDWRVFAATGVPVGRRTQAEIAERAKAWVFHYESEESREEHTLCRSKRLLFLRKNRDLFPPGLLPTHPAELAALAVRIYKLFAETKAASHGPSALPDAIVQGIVTALNEP
jgi:hypothetical protein